MDNLDFYGMFDFADGDDDTYRYTSAEFSELISGITGNGVSLNTLNSFETTNSGLVLTVGTGVCFINGRYGANHSPKTITLTATTASTSRYDRLVLELDIASRVIGLKVIQGTENSSPSVPALTRTNIIYDIPLYKVLISNGSDTFLTDERQLTFSAEEIYSQLMNRSLVGHTHTLSEISGITINSSASNIKMNGTVSAGTGTAVARANHVHPTDTSRAAASHKHPLADVTGISISSAAPKMDGTASSGTSTAVSRADHVHPTDTSRAAAEHDHDLQYYPRWIMDAFIGLLFGPDKQYNNTVDFNNYTEGGVSCFHNNCTFVHGPANPGMPMMLLVLASHEQDCGVQILMVCESSSGSPFIKIRSFYNDSFTNWRTVTL